MANARRATMAVVMVLLFIVGVYFGSKLPRLLNGGGPRRVYDTPMLLQQVQTLSELVTVKYVLQKVEVWDDPPPPVLSLFSGDNRVLLLAQGTVKAGIDLSQIKPEDVRIRDKAITIKLPPAQVTDCYLNDKETKVIERSTGLFRSFDKDLEQKIRNTVLEDMRRDALRGGIRGEAEDRARKQLASLFTIMGFEKVEFILSGPTRDLGLGSASFEIQPSNAFQDRTVPQNHSRP
jgi:Protein of unknown function (DUF4230)